MTDKLYWEVGHYRFYEYVDMPDHHNRVFIKAVRKQFRAYSPEFAVWDRSLLRSLWWILEPFFTVDHDERTCKIRSGQVVDPTAGSPWRPLDRNEYQFGLVCDICEGDTGNYNGLPISVDDRVWWSVGDEIRRAI